MVVGLATNVHGCGSPTRGSHSVAAMSMLPTIRATCVIHRRKPRSTACGCSSGS